MSMPAVIRKAGYKPLRTGAIYGALYSARKCSATIAGVLPSIVVGADASADLRIDLYRLDTAIATLEATMARISDANTATAEYDNITAAVIEILAIAAQLINELRSTI